MVSVIQQVSYPMLDTTMACDCHGDHVVCRCGQRIELGEPYALNIDGVAPDEGPGALSAELVCVYCSGKPDPEPAAVAPVRPRWHRALVAACRVGAAMLYSAAASLDELPTA